MLYVFTFICFLNILIMQPGITLSQPGVPNANPAIDNPVPLNVIKKIAIVKSQQMWGQGVLGDPIPLSDLNGDLIVYMFPYCIGQKEFPSYANMMQGIKQGRELQDLIMNSQMEKAKEIYLKLDSGKVKTSRTIVKPNTDGTALSPKEPVRPDGQPSRKTEYLNISKFAADKAIGANEFGTIFVSATYDLFPVLAYFHYLAPYYVNFDLAVDKAGQFIGPGASLEKIYFLGLEGQYFEFKNNDGKIVLNGKTLEDRDLQNLKNSNVSPKQSQPDTQLSIETKEKIKADLLKAWNDIISETGA